MLAAGRLRQGLARLYQDGGRHDDAITVLEEAVAATQEALEPEHPWALAAREELGRGRAAGRNDEAISHLSSLLADAELTLDPDSWIILKTREVLERAHAARLQPEATAGVI